MYVNKTITLKIIDYSCLWLFMIPIYHKYQQIEKNCSHPGMYQRH